MDNVILTWLATTSEDQNVPHDVMVDAIGRCMGFFYIDDGMVGYRDTEWIQHSIKIPVLA